MKEEPAAAGKGARCRGTPLSILGFRMGAVVAGGGRALAGRWRGDRRRKSLAQGGGEGGRGLVWVAADRQWGVVSGRRGGAGAGGSAGGGWRLRGVQVEDKLQALPKLHVKCLSATIAFSFDSNTQIPQ